MNKRNMNLIAVSLFWVFFVACAAKTKMVPDITATDLSPKLQSGEIAVKVDSFLVIMDASLSMDETYQSYHKFDSAKAFVRRMNHTLPPMEIPAGLRTFGHSPTLTKDLTKLFYGMTPYRRDGMDKGLDEVTKAGGTTPMAQAIAAATDDLKGTTGKTAVIIVSDAKDLTQTPIEAAEMLKAELGDRLCLYTVLVGDDDNGNVLMEKLAAVTPCGFMSRAQDVGSAEAMVDFVHKVFLGKVAKAKTPAPKPMSAPAPIMDSDGDGVPDSRDDCPDTPKGARVNARGCWILENVFFDFDKWNIKPDMRAGLEETLRVLNRNPNLKIEIQGHTDSIGPDAYNQKLSEERAKAVMHYFVKSGIAANRLSAMGYGESQPVAGNETNQGRAQNRRVELKPIK